MERLQGLEDQGVCERLCLSVMSEAMPTMAHQHDPGHKMNKDNNRQAKCMIKKTKQNKTKRMRPMQRTTGN